MKISAAAIERTLSRIRYGKYDREFFELAIANSNKSDRVAYVVEESAHLERRIKTQSEILGLVRNISRWLDKYPLLWVPTYTCVAEAVHDGRQKFVVLSEGFLSLIRGIAEFNVLRSIFDQRQRLDNRTDDEREFQTTEFNQMFMRVFSSQFSGEDAVPFPSVFAEDSPEMLLTDSRPMSAITETFVVMHEVGHLELGHLSSKWWQIFENERVRSELLIPEDMNDSKSQEHEADFFAISQADVAHQPLLLNGAKLFFSLGFHA